MPYMEPQLVVGSAARTANGNSAQLDPGEAGETINLIVSVTAAAGTTPSLALSVEWSVDGVIWATPEAADAFTTITGSVNRVKAFERKAPFYRIAWAITGTTPSFTFQIHEYVTN